MPQKQLAKRRADALTRADKQTMLERVKKLNLPMRTFVSEIFAQAKEARGRLDDDVYGVLYATLEALKQTGGMPPPLVFGISHYQTGKVEQVGFMPNGIIQLPPGGKFITNHPALNPLKTSMPVQLQKKRKKGKNSNQLSG